MKTFLILASTLAAGLLLSGCTSTTPVMDSRFGDSVKILNAQQTYNPAASASTAPANVDGIAAKEAFGQYKKSFSSPTVQGNVFNIGIGSGSNSGSGSGTSSSTR